MVPSQPHAVIFISKEDNKLLILKHLYSPLHNKSALNFFYLNMWCAGLGNFLKTNEQSPSGEANHLWIASPFPTFTTPTPADKLFKNYEARPQGGHPKLNNSWLVAVQTTQLFCQLRRDKTVSALASVKQMRQERNRQLSRKSQKLCIWSRSNKSEHLMSYDSFKSDVLQGDLLNW